MSRSASVFLGSLGTSLLVASTALAQSAGGSVSLGASTEAPPGAAAAGSASAPPGGAATSGAAAPAAAAPGSVGASADADVAADAPAADLDPGHRFLFDVHVGGLGELDADDETQSPGGALIGGNVFYGPLTWLSIGLGYERLFLGKDDEALTVGEDRGGNLRTSRGAHAIWLTGRLYPYENEDFALFLDLAGAPVFQDISATETLPTPDLVDPSTTLGTTCEANDSAKFGMRAGLGVEFPLSSLLIMHAQAGVDHYRFGSDVVDDCSTGGNPATYFAGRVGFAIATGRIKPVDSDGDGILDEVDACPEVRGVASEDKAKHGCPLPSDRDRDTVLDVVDACPDIPGAVQADPRKNGCPLPGDADGDGITDDVDACRDVPGVANPDPAKHGCPADQDGDGIIDAQDACPTEPGVANADPAKNGCPVPADTDGDGILDVQDACPKDPGKPDPDPTKHGCPLVTVTDKEIVIREQVQFDFGLATIKPASNGLLDNVASVIKGTPAIKKLEVQGHTDNKGGAQLNKNLSQRRADAVRKALETRGVAAAMMVSKGYGPDKPIADNATDEGRTKNRRVQFLITERDAPPPPTTVVAPSATQVVPPGAPPPAPPTIPAPAPGTTPPPRP